MSADAWETCPVCHNRPDEYPDGIDHLYGKVPREEFSKLEKELERLEQEPTVREDYEVGLNNDGTAYVSLSFRCTACGAEWNFCNDRIEAE